MFEYKQVVEATPQRRKNAERDSILSACTGAMGDVTLTDSAVIIIYAGMLGAGDMFAMATTSLMPLMNGLFVLPMAWLAGKFGNQGLIIRAASFAFLAYLLVAAAPFFGGAAAWVMISMLMVFAWCNTGYVAGWFPMLDSFLTPQRRSGYLGKMRFLWQLSAALFIFLIGLTLGKEPPLWQLQLVLALGAVIFAGRIYFISRIPVFPSAEKARFDFRTGLATALANKPLTGYSVYLFVLNLAAYGTIPLVTIYLKQYWRAPDNIVVMISSVTLVGMLLGSLTASRIIRRFGIRRTLLAIHFSYALVNILIFTIGKGFSPGFAYLAITFLVLIYSFTFAAANVASTTEMMALATPGNKAMALAFCGTFYYSGSGLSRLLGALILGSGILAPSWSVGGVTFCHYQSLFLFYSVAIVFAAMLLVVVPAIFPKGEYCYGGLH